MWLHDAALRYSSAVQCAACSVHLAVWSVQCAVCRVQSEVRRVQCSVLCVHLAVFSVQHSVFIIHYSVCSVQCSVCSVQYAVFNVQFAVCSVTLGWQYPYSVQQSAQAGQPPGWSSSSSGVLQGGLYQLYRLLIDLRLFPNTGDHSTYGIVEIIEPIAEKNYPK